MIKPLLISSPEHDGKLLLSRSQRTAVCNHQFQLHVVNLTSQLMPPEAGPLVMSAYGVTTQVGSDFVVADRPDRGTGAKWAFTLSSSQSRGNRIFPPTGALFMDADPSEYVSRLDPWALYRLYGRRA